MRFLRGCCLAMAAILVCAAESKTGLKPRDLFYETDAPQPGVPSVSTAGEGQRSRTAEHFAIRYRVLLKAQDGFKAVDAATTVFHDKDAVRLNLTANQDFYLYVMQKNAAGEWVTLFPQPDMAPGANRLTAFENRDFPDSPGAFSFDSRPGVEEAFIVFSRTPNLPTLKTTDAVPADPEAAAAASDGTMAARDLVFQKVDERTGPEEGTATYVTLREDGPSTPLILKIRLRHEPNPRP